MKNKVFIVLGIILVGVGLFVGYRLGKPAGSVERVTTQSIMQALKHEGFLVTETYIVTQQINVDRSTGSVFKDFFWGQDIVALGTMKTSLGVDLNKLEPADIAVSARTITISVPAIENHGVELIGDVTLQNKQGILKKIFNNDDGYNTAYAKLKDAALSAANSAEVQTEARANTSKEIERLLQLAAPDRQVIINFK